MLNGYLLEELYDREECPEEEMEAILEYIYEELDENFSCGYAAINMEKGGKKNRVHVTAYVQIKYQPRTMKAWQKMFLEHPHIEECYGDSNSNINYIHKRGTDENEKKHDTLRWGPVCVGEMRNLDKVDKKEFVRLIGQGKSYWEIVQEYPDALVEAAYGINKAIESRYNRHGNDSNVHGLPVQGG